MKVYSFSNAPVEAKPITYKPSNTASISANKTSNTKNPAKGNLSKLAYEAGKKKYGSSSAWYDAVTKEQKDKKSFVETLQKQLDYRKQNEWASSNGGGIDELYGVKNTASEGVKTVEELEKELSKAQAELDRANLNLEYATEWRHYDADMEWMDNVKNSGQDWGFVSDNLGTMASNLSAAYDDKFKALAQAQKNNEDLDKLRRQGGIPAEVGIAYTSPAEIAKMEAELAQIGDLRDMANRRYGYSLDELASNDKQSVERGKLRADHIAEMEERAYSENIGGYIEGMESGQIGSVTGVDIYKGNRRDFRPTDTWNEEQLNRYYVILDRQGEQAAADFAVKTNTYNNLLAQQEGVQGAYEWGNAENGIGRGLAVTAATVATSPERLVSFVDKARRVEATGAYTGTTELWAHDYLDAAAQGRADKLNELGTVAGKGLGDIYQLTNSMAQSLVYGNMVGSAGTLVMFFGQAADQGFDDAMSRGATPEQAVSFGLLSGVAEAAAELVPLENLLNADKTLTRGFLKSAMIQAGLEGLEEGETNVMNALADQLVMGDKSAMNQAIQERMAAGESYEDAAKAEWGKFVKDTVWSMLGGAISGAGSSAIQYGITMASPYQAVENGVSIYGATAEQLGREAAAVTDNKKLADLGKKVETKAKAGDKITNYTAKKLAEGTNRVSIVNATEQQVKERVPELNDKDARALANAIVSESRGEKNGPGNQKLIEKHRDIADTLLNELGKNGEVAEWAQKIGVRGVEQIKYGNRDIVELEKLKDDIDADAPAIVEADMSADVTIGDVSGTVSGLKLSNGKPQFAVTNSEGKEQYVNVDEAISSGALPAGMARLAYESLGLGDAATEVYNLYNAGQNVSEYVAAMDEAISIAADVSKREAFDKSETVQSLTAEQKDFAWNFGQQQRSKKQESRKANKGNKRKPAKAGTVSFDGVTINGTTYKATSRDKVKAADLRVIERIAKAANVNVVFYESDSIDGMYQGANGFYRNGTVYLDVHAAASKTTQQDAILLTAAHELTHHIRLNAEAQYDVLKEFVIEHLLEQGQDFETMVQNKLKDKGMKRSDAVEEVIADACEMVLKDSKAVEKLAKENKSLAQTIADWLHGFYEDIKAAFEGVEARSKEAKAMTDYMDELVKLWDDALIEASKGESKQSNVIRYSFRKSTSGMANDKLSPYNEELNQYIKNGGDYIIDSLDALESAVNMAFDSPDKKATLYFGNVSPEDISRIEASIENLPTELKGKLFKPGRTYSVIATLDSIRHLKDEKNISTENVLKYMDRYADTVVDFDDVHFDYYFDSYGNRLNGLRFRKQFDDGFQVSFDIVSNKKRSLALITEFIGGKTIKKKSAKTLPLNNSEAHTPKARAGQTSINIIDEVAGNVNTDSQGNSLSQEQQEYFKDSKIRVSKVDGWDNTISENGALFPVYHGTNSGEFFEFDKKMIGSANDSGWYGKGFYFAFTENEASHYGHKVLECYLDVKKPFMFSEELQEYDGQETSSLNGGFASFIINLSEKFPEIAQRTYVDVSEKASDEIVRKPFSEIAREIKEIYYGDRLKVVEVDDSGKKVYEYKYARDVDSIDAPDRLKTIIKEKYIDSAWEAEYLYKAGEISDADLDTIYDLFEKYGEERFADAWIRGQYSSKEQAEKYRLSAAVDYLENNKYSYMDIHSNHYYMENFVGDAFTEEIRKRGYDGIIQSRNGDEIVVFEPEQIKLTDNKNPTSNPDIRYSRRDSSEGLTKEEARAQAQAYTRLKAENAALQRRLEYWQGQTKRTKIKTIRKADIDKLANRLKRQYGTDLDVETIKQMLTDMGNALVQNEGNVMGYITGTAQELAYEILSNVFVEDRVGRPVDTAEIIADIKDITFKLDRAEFDKLPEGFRKKYSGKIHISSKEGLNVAEAYNQLRSEHGQYTELFPADITDPIGQLAVVAEAYDTLMAEPVKYNPYASHINETTLGLSYDIINEILGENVRPNAPTIVDKYETRLQELKHQETAKRKAQVAKERAEKWDKVASVKEYYQNMMRRQNEVRKENAATKKYRDRVLDRVNTLSNWLIKNSDKEHIPEGLKAPLIEFLNSIDPSSKTLLKKGETTRKDERYEDKMQRLRDILAKQNAYMQNPSENDGLDVYLDLPNGFDETIRQHIESVRAILNNQTDVERSTPLVYMTSEQLKDLDFILSTLTTSIRQINKFITDSHFASVIEGAQDSMQFLRTMGASADKSMGAEQAEKFMAWSNALPIYVFKRFGAAGQERFAALIKGWGQMAKNVQAAIKFAEDTYNADEVKAWEESIQEITLSNGRTARMTEAQIMGLYCSFKREQARGHLLAGGMRVGDIETKGAKGKKITQADAYQLTLDDIISITGLLSVRQMEVADKLQNYFNTTCAEWGNQVSMARFGYRQFTENNYYPITTDQNNHPAVDPKAQETDIFRLLNMSATKALTPNANNSIVIFSIFDVFSAHASDMAKYNALALPILDLLKWYNYKDKSYREVSDSMGNTNTQLRVDSVQGGVERTYGKMAQNYMINFLKDLNGKREGGRNEEFLKGLLGKYKAAAVGANLRVAIQQPTSIVRAAYMLNPGYIARGAGMSGGIEEAMKYSGLAVWKSMGYFDTNISRNMRQQIKHADTAMDKLRDKSMKLAELGDKATWGALWNACKLEQMDKGVSGDELMKATADRFNEVILSTQVLDSTISRSDMMRNQSLAVSEVTSFMSEPTVSYNMLMDSAMQFEMARRQTGSITEARKQTWPKMGRAVTVFATSTLATAAAAAIIEAMRDDDEYQDFVDKWLEALSKNFKQGINPIRLLPIFSDLWEIALNDETPESMIWQSFTQAKKGTTALVDMVKLWFNPDADVSDPNRTNWGRMYFVAQAIGSISGIPVAGFMREFKTVWNMSGRLVTGKALKNYDSGIKNTVKYGVIDGYIDEEKAIALLTASGEYDNPDDIYWQVQEWLHADDSEWTRYTELDNAMLAGNVNAFKAAQESLGDHGIEPRSVRTHAKGQIEKWFVGEGDIPAKINEDTALDYLQKFAGLTKIESQHLIDEWKFEKATGFKWSALKDEYVKGTFDDKTTQGYLINYGHEYSKDAAEKVQQWKCEKETGVSYSYLSDAYIHGEITDKQAISYLQKYGGESQTEAETKVAQWSIAIDYGIKYSSTDAGIKKALIEGYISDETAKALMITYGDKTPEEAEDYVNQYHFTEETGYAWSEIEEAYADGIITYDEMVNWFMEASLYTHGSAEIAEEYARVAEWKKNITDADSINRTALEKWDKKGDYMQRAGLNEVDFADAWSLYSESYSQYDANGNKVKEKAQVFFEKLFNLMRQGVYTEDEIDAIARTVYSKSYVNKYAMW